MAVDLSKLSDAELQAIASGNMASLSDETLQMLAGVEETRPPSTAAVAAEAARKGVAGLPSFLAGAGALIGESALGRGLPELFMPSAQPTGRAPTQAFMQAQQPVQQALMERLGTTGVKPVTTGQKLFSAGVEAVTSPESYVFPPLAAIRRLGLLGQAVARPAEQAVVGTGAEAGGMGGEYAGEKMGAPTTGRIVGGLLGGGGTAFVAGQVGRQGALVGKGFDLLKDQWQKVSRTVPEDELMKDVDRRITNIFNAAMDADPNIAKLIREAVAAQEGISLKAPGAPEVKLPLSAILANNPVIDAQVRKLAGENEVFRTQYGAQYDAAKQALAQNQIRLFGDPSKAVVKATAPDFSKTQAMLVKSLDEQIANAYQGQSIDPNAFGQRVSDLVARKEKAAYAEVKPLYTEAFDIAKAKNLELPAASVDDIYNFVVNERTADIFKNFPEIYKKVTQRFKPVTTEPSPILTSEGVSIRPGGKSFYAATVEDLDSLKREINASLRASRDENNIRLLSELKSRVGGHIDSLDPDFVTAYRNADKAYLQKVGLPFDTATLAAIDRKKFVEQIAPVIIGNKSQVLDFINATGDQGTKLVRDAFTDAFTTAALKDGMLDPKAAAKWIKKNEGGVSLVPGLREELDSATRNVQQLIDKRAQLNADFQRVAGEQILSKEGVRGPQELVNRMYGDINFTNRFMTQYRTDKDSVGAARAFMLDDIIKSNDPVGMLSDRNRAAVFNRVFGPKYSQIVRDFAVASGRMKVDPTQVAFRVETVPKTVIEDITGTPPQQIISRFLNPVSGPLYAITTSISKFWAKQASEATERKLINLLSDPAEAVKFMSTLEKAKKSMSPGDIENLARIGAKYGIDWVKDAANDIMSGAARGAVQQPQE
jgi:hypothetical protein